MFGWRKKTIATPEVDIHSHLIPAIDDGIQSLDDSIQVIRKFADLGFKKAITTPHIHPNYPNTIAEILGGLEVVQEKLIRENIDFELEAAAEYFVDDVFMQKVNRDEDILTFGPNYVLVESSFMNKPLYFETCLFELQSKGYQPVLAHPERYRFLEGDTEWLHKLKESGILFQVTVSSFSGFYGKIPQKISKELNRKAMIDFLGSDLHSYRQIQFLEDGLRLPLVEKLCKTSALKNNSLR